MAGWWECMCVCVRACCVWMEGRRDRTGRRERLLRCIKVVRMCPVVVVNIWTMGKEVCLSDGREVKRRLREVLMNMGERVSVYVYVWRLLPHFNLTRLSVQAWIFVHIKLARECWQWGSVHCVCGRRCLGEEKKKKWGERKRKGVEVEEEEEDGKQGE